MNPDIPLMQSREDNLFLSSYLYSIILDSNNKIVHANRKFINQSHQKSIVVKEQYFEDSIFPDDFMKYNQLVEKALSQKERSFIIDLRKLQPDGSDFYWTRWEFSIELNNGKLIHIHGIGHKIQKFTDNNMDLPLGIKDMDIKNEIIEGLFNNNLIGFWFWDIPGHSDQISLSLYHMLDISHNGDKLTNRPLWKEKIHQDDQNIVNLALKDHFETKGKNPFISEFRLKLGQEKEIWVTAYGKVIEWTSEGEPKTMVGGFFDVSGQKRSEELFKKQKDYIQQLTFSQSHFMRARLANIMGILEVIQQESKGNHHDHFIKIIKSEARKLDNAIKMSIAQSTQLQSDEATINLPLNPNGS